MSETPKPRYGAGFRSHNVGQREPIPPPWPAADWALWAFMPKATLRGAVLLSVGLEPHPVREVQSGYAPPVFADPGREFQRRLTLACTHLSEQGPLRPLHIMQMLRAPADVEVSLPEFRAWAEGLGWPMPERFPCAKAHAPAMAARDGTKEERQDRRLKACEDAGLRMPAAPEGRLPDGVGEVAAAEHVSRQAFTADLRAALTRRAAAQREGVTRHRIE